MHEKAYYWLRRLARPLLVALIVAIALVVYDDIKLIVISKDVTIQLDARKR